MKPLQYVLGILCFVVLGVFAVFQQVQVYRLGYDLSATLDDVQTLEEDNRILREEISRLRSPQRLATAAHEYQLALVPPEEVKAPKAAPVQRGPQDRD